MYKKSLQNICLVCFDDSQENPKRSCILDIIFKLNLPKRGDEAYHFELEKYNRNKSEYIKKFRVQQSIYFIYVTQVTTIEYIINYFQQCKIDEIDFKIIYQNTCYSSNDNLNF